MLTAVHLYMPLSVALAGPMLKVLVKEGVVSDCFSVVPLKIHFQVGAGFVLAAAVHLNVTGVFSGTSDAPVGPLTFGTAAQSNAQNRKVLKNLHFQTPFTVLNKGLSVYNCNPAAGACCSQTQFHTKHGPFCFLPFFEPVQAQLKQA